jgi:hypothetical protein
MSIRHALGLQLAIDLKQAADFAARRGGQLGRGIWRIGNQDDEFPEADPRPASTRPRHDSRPLTRAALTVNEGTTIE